MLRKYHTLVRMNPIIFNRPQSQYYFILTPEQLSYELNLVRPRLNFSSPTTRHLYLRKNNTHRPVYNEVIDKWLYQNRVNHNVAKYLLLHLSDFPTLMPIQINTWKICCQELIIHDGLREYLTGDKPPRDSVANLIKHKWKTPIGVPPEFGQIYENKLIGSES